MVVDTVALAARDCTDASMCMPMVPLVDKASVLAESYACCAALCCAVLTCWLHVVEGASLDELWLQVALLASLMVSSVVQGGVTPLMIDNITYNSPILQVQIVPQHTGQCAV